MAAPALREVFAALGFKVDSKQLDKAAQKTEAFIGKMRNLGTAIAGAVIIRQIFRFIDATRAMGDELDKTAQQVGLTTAELQAFRFAADLSGVGAVEFSNALGQLQRKAAEAAEGSGAAADTFRRLRIEVRDATTGEVRQSADLLRDFSDAMQDSTNPTQRVADSMEIMGRQGRRLLPLLTQGSEGLAAMQAEAEALGGGLSEGAIAASVELTDDLARMKLALQSIRSQIAVLLLPILSRVTAAMTQLSAGVNAMTRDSNIAAVALSIMGAAAAAAAVKFIIAWGSVLGPIALAVLAIGVLILWIDDLVTAVQGGESLTGEAFDEIGRLLLAWQTDISRAFDDLRQEVTAALVAIGTAVTDFINDLFGFDIVQQIVMGAAFAFDEASRIITEALAFVGTQVSALGNVVIGLFAQLMEIEQVRAAVEAFEEVWNRIVQAVTSGSQAIANGLESLGIGGAPELTDEEFVRRANASARTRRDKQEQRERSRLRSEGAQVTAQAVAVGGARARARRPERPTQNVDARTDLNLTINAADADADAVARLAQQRVEAGLERQRRQTLQALEQAPQEA